MDLPCDICNHPEPNYTPPPNTDYTCKACIQNLLKFTQDELKAGHALAIEKGYTAKADAIASFSPVCNPPRTTTAPCTGDKISRGTSLRYGVTEKGVLIINTRTPLAMFNRKIWRNLIVRSKLKGGCDVSKC
jgi:hypothetical protein